MKINATTRLLAANLPPELLDIDNKSYFRKELARQIRRFGIDLNTAKFEKISNEEALRALKGNKGFGVLFCFNTKCRNEPECSVIGLIKTSESRYSTSRIISTRRYARLGSPTSIIKNCDLVYFVRGNQADYDRLSKLHDERYYYSASLLYPRDYAKENKDRYAKQLAERRFQTAKANATEIVKLIQDTVVNSIHADFTDDVAEYLEKLGKKIEKAIRDALSTSYTSSYLIIRINKSDSIDSLQNFAEQVNMLAQADMNKVRSALNNIK